MTLLFFKSSGLCYEADEGEKKMKFKIGLILWGVAFLAAENRASAMPAQVVIIRHGEKPAEGNGLNARGFQRAAALPQFFQNNPTVTAFGPAAAIYAMKP